MIVADCTALPPLRHQVTLTQPQVATTLNINPAKTFLIERGLAHDNDGVTRYHDWVGQHT